MTTARILFSIITLVGLTAFDSPTAHAKTLHQSFELLAPPNIRDPYVLDIPFRVDEVGMIQVHVTFESASSNKVKQMAAMLMQDVRKGRRANVKVKRQQSAQMQYAVDSLNLKQTHQFMVRLVNPDPNGTIRGRITIDFPGKPKPLPDLVITNTRTDSDCRLMFTVTNKGKGMVDLTSWDKNAMIDVAIERNNKFWGAAAIRVIDPIQRLAHPGGFAHYRTTLKAPIGGSENIALVIDRNNRLKESNEQNNRQNYSLSCAMPDLTITRLTVNNQCEVIAHIKNSGDARLLPSAYDIKGPTVFINRNGRGWGGKALVLVDPQKALSRPGGTVVYKSGLKLGTNPEKIQVLVDKENKVKEKNDNNNFRNAELSCQPKPPSIQHKPAKPMRLNIQ